MDQEPYPNQEDGCTKGLDGSRYLYDGAWWTHEAPSAAEMMEEAWKSGRQVYRLLLAMDR